MRAMAVVRPVMAITSDDPAQLGVLQAHGALSIPWMGKGVWVSNA
jgi:hypothetical protein